MKRLFFYCTIVFVLLMTVLLIFQYQRENNFRTQQLDSELNSYNNIIYNFVSEKNHSNTDVRDFMRVFPDSTLRITVINLNGEVMFDSFMSDSMLLENHIDRPEIIEAKKKGIGQTIRFSNSIGTNYYYYAQAFNDMYVRTALPYNSTLQKSLNIDTTFIYFMAALFILAIIAVYFITIKITQQIESEETLMRKQLTLNISHELKTPVASISGYLESILNNPAIDPEKQYSFIQRSFEQTKRLAALLQDISILNKLAEDKNVYPKTACDLKEIIQTVTNDVRFQTEEKHCNIEADLSETMPINGNQSLLYSIFQNLTNNALAYAGEGSTIKVKALCDDYRFYYISFADNGVGVPEEHLGRIFERFYRVDNGRSRKTGGTGLGLSIVKNAVLFHGGTINVKNNPTGGLEFTFSLKK